MSSWGQHVLASALLLAVAAGSPGCTRTKKLSSGETSLFEDLRHGVLGQDREAADYVRIVQESRAGPTLSYRVTDDKYLVDKVVDAVQRLGKLEYQRPDAQARVMALLADVLRRDPSALARTHAANSLTRLALRLPVPQGTQFVPDGGTRMRALVRELGAMRTGSTRTLQAVDELGRLRLSRSDHAAEALQPLYAQPVLVGAGGALRTAVDRALTTRMRSLARLALREAVDAETNFVREEAVRGLKTMRDVGSEPLILRRLGREFDVRVRAEIVEYLGIPGTGTSVAALLPLLDDGDPTIRLKARQSLTRTAGRDLGFRRVTWTRWALERYPELRSLRAADGPSPSPVGMR